ncbi:MAG TPA: NAD(P)-dependent oxidoreductase [Proteiniclasticum sp.]|nr:NAD(P)-dependent oxidoreductase [Proteiniclasticum sp.]
MENIVFLNSARLDFDQQLDFSQLDAFGNLTSYDESNDEEIIKRVNGQSIVITKELPMNGDLIERFPSSVKLICEAGTGYNNIDLEAARRKGIAVCNVPGYSTEAVAQLVITFMLNLSSSMIRQQEMLRNKNFTNFTSHLQVPHLEIQNKTLGILGAGAIGNQVIKIALALGMEVLTNTRTARVYENPHIRSVSLDDLLKQSDFISIHVPLTPETKHMINKNRLGQMKPSAFLINTSRGSVINEVDLIKALQDKVIAGAALDVLEQEPPDLNNPLLYMNNVILTPHIGWKCLESRQRLIKLLSTNIASFIQGDPVNIVNE